MEELRKSCFVKSTALFSSYLRRMRLCVLFPFLFILLTQVTKKEKKNPVIQEENRIVGFIE